MKREVYLGGSHFGVIENLLLNQILCLKRKHIRAIYICESNKRNFTLHVNFFIKLVSAKTKLSPAKKFLYLCAKKIQITQSKTLCQKHVQIKGKICAKQKKHISYYKHTNVLLSMKSSLKQNKKKIMGLNKRPFDKASESD